MGAICLRKGLEVVALVATKASRFLALQADLHGSRFPHQRSLVGRVTEMLSFTPETRSNAAT